MGDKGYSPVPEFFVTEVSFDAVSNSVALPDVEGRKVIFRLADEDVDARLAEFVVPRLLPHTQNVCPIGPRNRTKDRVRTALKSSPSSLSKRKLIPARVATSRNVLGGPDRARPAAAARRTSAAEFRLAEARHKGPMARMGAPLEHPLSHAQGRPLLLLGFRAAQSPALPEDLACLRRRKPVPRMAAGRQSRHHGRFEAHAAPGGRAAPFQTESASRLLPPLRSSPRVQVRART